MIHQRSQGRHALNNNSADVLDFIFPFFYSKYYPYHEISDSQVFVSKLTNLSTFIAHVS